jgi:ABC-type glycerol-3-phosphate transport system substrate-binding protein
MTHLKTIVSVALALILIVGVLARAGMTRRWIEDIGSETSTREELRVWDWWSASTNEEYGAYFAEIERTFEAQHPNIDIIYQIVPFGNYVQKLSTAMVGDSPPDVFQSSVYWAEGFYQRGMLRPLDDLLASESDADPGNSLAKEHFLPTAWRHNHALDGTVFGIPQIIDASCLLWNLDILQEASSADEELRDLFAHFPDGSIDYDRLRFDALHDWDHFRRIVDKLTIRDDDGNIERAGFVLSAYGSGAGMFSPWLASNGGRVQDAAGTRALFASAAGVETLEFLARLYWVDRISPPFHRQMTPSELFQERKVASVTAGTWSGKDITRNSLGWTHFGKTAFPPGPSGDGPSTVTWGNMLVITRRAENVDAAWAYLKFVCGLPGSLLRSKHLGYNGPRYDFYATQRWQEALAERPYLSTVKQICLVGEKLRHTEITAVDHQANPIFESVLLHYPEIVAGDGPHESVEAALQLAARNVDNVYARYNEQVARWLTERRWRGQL